ncbi:CD80-like C2-set immunoglobulin domain containing protein, partial [Dinothrombium tinctorium]
FSQYIASIGEKIGIQCNASFWGDDDVVSLILWYKGNTGVPLYSIDARDTPLLEAKHITSESRLYLNVSLSPPMLFINPIELSDSGEYRCRIDYASDRTQNSIVSLQVVAIKNKAKRSFHIFLNTNLRLYQSLFTVPPKEVIIMDTEGQRLEGIVGPYDEGTNLSLICQSYGGIVSSFYYKVD